MKFNNGTKSLRAAIVIVAAAFGVCSEAVGQKSEHYNSPLYSPKYYDPSQGTSNGLPEALQKVGIEQKLGESLPLDAEFKDEDGKPVKLGDYFAKGRPVVLALVYFECPMLCNQVLNGMTGSMKGISLDAGKDFEVVAISFDARENDKPDLGKNKKASYLERYGRPGTETGFHFLTGTQSSIDAVTKAAGFNYEWDEKSNQFAHASAIMIVNPDGKLSRYLYGIDYSPKDLKFGIIESADNKVGSAADQLLLYCYHYDPATGKYGFAVLSAMRMGGILTLLGLGAMGFVFWRRNKKVRSE
ncbi:MAG: SCO family protein [Pyrinomonadaceae bacterium]|nr:SCO family protein [Blastocatellia bacterium]MCW5955746.1 SCO family protein [Pyrinomonadaceae bacterium]